MNIETVCAFCIIDKQKKVLESHKNSPYCKAYLDDVLKLMGNDPFSHNSVWLTREIERIYDRYFDDKIDYVPIKQKYNQIMLLKAPEFQKRIAESEDPLKTAILYCCMANYIDFGAMDSVSDDMLNELLNRKAEISEEELSCFKEDLQKAKTLVYVTDNCGEIVLDKLLIREIKERFPEIRVTVLVRGELVGNDATLEDAVEVGMTDVAECIGNGSNLYGTDFSEISSEAISLLESADMIISKGQANFETIHGNNVDPYYLFLCKCGMFTNKFNLPLYSPVLIKDCRLAGV